MLDALPDGVYVVDRDRRVTFWNAAAEAITGYAAGEILGQWCGANLLNHVDEDGRRLCGDRCPLLATLEDGQVRGAQILLHHRAGHLVPVEVRAAPMRDEQGRIVGAVETFRDDTARFAERVHVRELEVAASTDSLTGLGNRRSLEVHLADRLMALEQRDVPLGVLMCDLDTFKHLNDEYGRWRTACRAGGGCSATAATSSSCWSRATTWRRWPRGCAPTSRRRGSGSTTNRCT
jgi:PAS domain S-box-containing protein